ncbi:serine/threonine protein kinase [Rhodopirellula sallentina]|uniref:non-specific serine/threonine protein kinase n=1 Tax=Rhodopirellula sallentina SM41 TaxID=1263870 RepID=M5U7B3_9BACT|nr:serine/threonine-protein kinase [Rhodopirellula sallentina]EMI57372.1 serine/threonine protein kinase [Rhodopirellula sallentina SM41]
MSELDETDDGRVVAAVKDYMRMLDAGNAPTTDEFLQQHADIAGELRPSLEGLAMVHRVAEPAPATVVAPDAEFTAKPIGDFQIVGELGRGGMGVVYEAIQLSLGRHVALKVLPFASGLDEVRLQRFRNEAHAAAAIHHTNIVPVYAVGSDRGIHYYAMQMIDGSTLAELIESMRESNASATIDDTTPVDSTVQPRYKKSPSITSMRRPSDPSASPVSTSPMSASPMSAMAKDTISRHTTVFNSNASARSKYYRTVVRMAHQAASAIHHAHQYGVVHRDIKPANLLIDSAGKIWVTDFGLAQVQTEASHLTRTGDPMGTLRYMSPEQAAGQRDELDHRTDIYSLGVTLYELLTLRPAIQGDGYREMLNNVALHEPPAPRSIDPALPIELDTIVRKAMAKLPSERYASAGDFADDLQAWLDDKPITAKPPTVIERLAKWRRRNSGLVAVAGGLLLFASLGLLITTLMIWREQRHTANALQREMHQREQAQRSFQQARNAVDTFSNLSESELAYRPDLQDLRRSFLETSLAFYQDFLDDRADDPTLAPELEATSARVSKMLEELQTLERIGPLRALGDYRVRREIGIEPTVADEIELAVEQFHLQRQAMGGDTINESGDANDETSKLARDFNDYVNERITPQQMKRLRQIMAQQMLPITFKSAYVERELELSSEQRDAINRIIENTRPRRGNGREGPGRGGPPRFGGPGMNGFSFGGSTRGGGGRGESRRDQEVGERSRGGGPGNWNEPGEPNGDPERYRTVLEFERTKSIAAQNTVNEILKILTPEQRLKWDDVIGEPFEG